MLDVLVFIIIIMLSVIFHEVAHGYAALSLGDETAKNEGRLTLNPIPHIDLVGTIIIPAALVLLSTGFIFGWAKPVPYNPYNLKSRYGEAFVAAAGPLTNFLLAGVFAILYRVGEVYSFPEPLIKLFVIAVFINIFLAILNLLPIPPLDGSKVVSSLLPVKYRILLQEKFSSLLNVNSIVFSILVLLFIVFFLIDYLALFTSALSGLFLGTPIQL